MGKYKPYPAYKDSGVEWLGDVPEGWELKRFKTLFTLSNEKNGFNIVGDMLSVSGYRGIEIKQYEDEAKKRLETELVDYRVVRKGQLVVNTMWLNYAGLGVSDFDGHVSPAYRSYWINKHLCPRFIHHLLRSSNYVEGYTKYMQGIRPNSLQIKTDDFQTFLILLPSLSEQNQIAKFIDQETAKIDRLIEKQEKLIELLKEKRQAVISHAVTKGLDPDVEMKDSGVEWLGEIPAHWVRTRVKFMTRAIIDGPHFSPKYQDDGVLFISARNIKIDGWAFDTAKYISEADYTEFSKRVLPEYGDVLLTKGGTTGIARAVDFIEKFQVWVHVAVLKTIQNKVLPSYFAYALNSKGGYDQSQLHTRGATNNDLGLSRIANIHLALPPHGEQIKISSFLDNALGKIDTLIKRSNDQIALLKECRTALISAAVTGKIDVRDWRAENKKEV